MTTATKPIFQKEKILIVDDIPKWIETAKNNLIYYGCLLENIVITEDIKSAFKKYQKERPNFILTDINFNINNLRDTQGLDLIKKIREDGYEFPIIAMSSLTENMEEKTKQAGANYFIDKRDFLRGFDNFTEWYSKEQSR